MPESLLDRIAHGGQVIAPGRPGRPLQYVDARDLASWMLSGLSSGVSGGVDVASPSDHATTQELLTACIAATGLVCRPVQETVNDTWRWLQQEGMPAQRPDRDAHGLPAELERLLLTAR